MSLKKIISTAAILTATFCFLPVNIDLKNASPTKKYFALGEGAILTGLLFYKRKGKKDYNITP